MCNANLSQTEHPGLWDPDASLLSYCGSRSQGHWCLILPLGANAGGHICKVFHGSLTTDMALLYDLCVREKGYAGKKDSLGKRTGQVSVTQIAVT